MNMAYTMNPFLPKVRAQAVEMVRSGKSVLFYQILILSPPMI